MEEMEKRSDRHIRDLVAHTAFKGLDANEIGCARISVMAGAIAPFKGPNTDEQDQLSPGRHIRLATHGRSIQMCHVWTAPSWQGESSRRVAGRCSHVFGLLVRFT
jgi:hypothetical protein